MARDTKLWTVKRVADKIARGGCENPECIARDIYETMRETDTEWWAQGLEWHHTDQSTKLYNPSDMYGKYMPFAKIDAETAKCELICKICHIKETIAQRQK